MVAGPAFPHPLRLGRPPPVQHVDDSLQDGRSRQAQRGSPRVVDSFYESAGATGVTVTGVPLKAALPQTGSIA